jgi:hypothetical protein
MKKLSNLDIKDIVRGAVARAAENDITIKLVCLQDKIFNIQDEKSRNVAFGEFQKYCAFLSSIGKEFMQNMGSINKIGGRNKWKK